jgi:hypothetical protein
MKKVFLSYSHADERFVDALAKDLGSAGIPLWIDSKELHIGDSLTDRIVAAIKECDFFVTVLSSSSLSSRWAKEELEQAQSLVFLGQRITIMPLLLESIEVPGFLLGKVYADFRSPDVYADSLVRLIAAIRSRPLPLSESEHELHSLINARIVPFVRGQLLLPFQFLRLQTAICLLESSLGLVPTKFDPFYKGQLLNAACLNAMSNR